MYIAGCKIKNYKGFNESEQINFTPGFNVVVGQNNAGKSALTEAISLQFQNNPHRSLMKSPDGNSSLSLVLKASSKESFDLLRKLTLFLVPFNQGGNAAAFLSKLNLRLKEELVVLADFTAGNFVSPRLDGFPNVGGGSFWAKVSGSEDELIVSYSGGSPAVKFTQLASSVCWTIKQRIYIFRAERLNIHQGPIGTNPVLESDARNLPEVLHFLQSSNRYRFERFVEDVRTVFPDIQDLAVSPVSNNSAKINVWFVDPKTD